MPDPEFVAPEKVAAEKGKGVSPARKMISYVILALVIAFGAVEVIPKWSYQSAVNKLDARYGENANDLLTMPDAETLIGKQADGAAVDVRQGSRTLAKKTYTWNGLLWHYTLTAFYSKEKNPVLIEYKTDRAEIQREQTAAVPPAAIATKGSSSAAKSAPTGSVAKVAPKGSPPIPSDKTAAPKTDTGTAATAKTAPSDKAASTKPDASAAAPKVSESDKPASAKPDGGSAAPKPSVSDKPASAKPDSTDSPAKKSSP